VENINGWQLYSTLPLIAAVLFIYFSANLAPRLRQPWIFRLSVIYAGLLVVPALISDVHYLYILSANKAEAHEYADNRTLADALEKIPVSGSMIATNDLRYPANGYRRDLEQFQLAAIFGQQNFAADLNYIGDTASMLAYKTRALAVLQAVQTLNPADPSCRATLAHSTTGITHFLIHKGYHQPQQIDLPLIYENSDYAVYLNTL